jgi:hypothetical protein
MASVCGYTASAIMAEMEIEPSAVIIKKEEIEEEKVDAFGRLIGRKAAVLENKRRSKCVEGLGDRELKRRKRLEQWCSKLGVLPLPSADFNSCTNNQSTTTSTDRQNIDNVGSIGIYKIKQEGGLLTSNIISDSSTPDIVIKSEVKDEDGIENDAKKGSSQDNDSTVGGVKRDHTSAVAGLGLGSGLGLVSEAQGREEELDQYYNPKKASRAGLGMGGLGFTPSSSSFTKGSSKSGSSVVTPFLSSFVKASAPAPAPSTVPALVPAPVFVPPPPVFVPPPVFNSNKSNINDSSSNGSSSSSNSSSSSSSSSRSSNSGASSVPTRPALSYTDCLIEYERAVTLSGLESIPLGDSCDLEDSELLGESLNPVYNPSLFLLLR